jgi:bacillithiol system protein YtxJ
MQLTNFEPMADHDALRRAFERSSSEPVVLFKHDPYCGISLAAHMEMMQLGGTVLLLDVSRDRAISREVAERTGVRHESPQVLVLRDGEAAWAGSHGEVTASTVAQALERWAPAATGAAAAQQPRPSAQHSE